MTDEKFIVSEWDETKNSLERSGCDNQRLKTIEVGFYLGSIKTAKKLIKDKNNSDLLMIEREFIDFFAYVLDQLEQ